MLTFTTLYPLYSSQITRLLHDKSEMWAIGFRNGLLSTKEISNKDSFMVHFHTDYEIGFREGQSYAIYKMALHLPKQNVITQ